MTWYALIMPKNRRTGTNIENGVNKKIGIPPQVKTTNLQSSKIGALSQVDIGYISGFQLLRIVNLKLALLDDLKTYVHWQIISPPYY